MIIRCAHLLIIVAADSSACKDPGPVSRARDPEHLQSPSFYG